MKYRIGDKIQIREWADLIKDNQVTYYRLVHTEAVNLPNGYYFSREQYDKICERCEGRIDTIERIDRSLEWYYLKDSKAIVTECVIQCEVIGGDDNVSRFDLLDI